MRSRHELDAELEARIGGFIAGAMFARYELTYYTEEGSRICGTCGITFWPFFDLAPYMQDRWRCNPERYPGIGGMSYPGLKDICHKCYVECGNMIDAKDAAEK